MLTPAEILLGLVVPAVICAAVLLTAWRPWNKDHPADGRWAGGLAIGSAYAIAYARLVGNFAFPPVDSDNWIVYFMALAAGLGVLFCSVLPRARLPKLAAVLCTSAAIVWLLLQPLIGTAISVRALGVWIAAFSLGLTLWWVLVNEMARQTRLLSPIVLFVADVGAAVALAAGGLAIRGGFILGAMAAILVTVVIVAAFTPGFRLAGGGTLAIMLALGGTIIYAYFNISPDPSSRLTSAMAITALSPLLAWVGWLPGIRKLPAWQRGAAAIITVLLAVGIAVALAAVGGQAAAL